MVVLVVVEVDVVGAPLVVVVLLVVVDVVVVVGPLTSVSRTIAGRLAAPGPGRLAAPSTTPLPVEGMQKDRRQGHRQRRIRTDRAGGQPVDAHRATGRLPEAACLGL